MVWGLPISFKKVLKAFSALPGKLLIQVPRTFWIKFQTLRMLL